MARKALLIVDVQNDFCPGGTLPVSHGDEVVAPLNRMIKHAEGNDWLILASACRHPESTTHFDKWPAHCVNGTHGADFQKDLQLGSAIVIKKGTGPNEDAYSPFDGRAENGLPLETVLRTNEVSEIFIGGLATDYCVKAAALDARKLGFVVYLLIDACRAVNREPGDEKAAIEEMTAAGVLITTTSAITKKRLPPTTFDLPIQKIRRGYYSAVYFWREKQILEGLGYNKKVLMQIFQKNNAVLCGTDEAIAVLKLCSGQYSDQSRAYKFFDHYAEMDRAIRRAHIAKNYRLWESLSHDQIHLEIALDELWASKANDLVINSLFDGDKIEPWETVMTIEGLPQYFAHLESVYLGILARRTLVATNVNGVVTAAQGKPILFFADRFDHYENQTGDGYAAMLGGAYGVATDIMGEWWGKKGIGTAPHALIACFNGDTTEATVAFAREYPDVPCISLVDFHNDCVATSIAVADRFKAEGLKLWGVRLDTSENMVDINLYNKLGSEKPTGVNPLLVRNVRNSLDAWGHPDVKIVVSGGFTREKIEYFEKNRVPVDAYGVGSSLLKGSSDFTADIVIVDGKPMAKTGRWYRPNLKLTRVE